MSYLVIGLVALIASALTFFSGFGLGTLLLPAFALFVPVEQAVALTAVVHLLNGLFKLGLVWRHADWSIVLRFGVPAIVMALLGAWLLTWLATIGPAFSWSAFGHELVVTPVKLAIGILLLAFASIELLPRARDLAFPARYLVLGGALSGFFGGLSGMQGALRSAFLARAGIDKQAFVGTGVAISVLIDVSRLAVYSALITREIAQVDVALLACAVGAAFLGAYWGSRHLAKTTLQGIQRIVAAMLFVVALGLMTGVL